MKTREEFEHLFVEAMRLQFEAVVFGGGPDDLKESRDKVLLAYKETLAHARMLEGVLRKLYDETKDFDDVVINDDDGNLDSWQSLGLRQAITATRYALGIRRHDEQAAHL